MALLLIVTVREPARKEVDIKNDISRSTLQNDNKSLVEQDNVETKSNAESEGFC